MANDIYIHDGPLIVGAGLAGLSTALACAPRPTLVLAPETLGVACSSAWAQGGIAAALSPDDTPAAHAADTLSAGAGTSDPAAVEVLTDAAPSIVRRLKAMGTPFDLTPDGAFVLNREAAHSAARVARVGGDLAGKAILEAVTRAALAAPHITVREHATALGLIRSDEETVCGVLCRIDGALVEIIARSVVLATGGCGGLYAVTTNPASLRAEGMAMAARAGALISDPEFVQFHPTALKVGRDPAPLATEALRGEGAVLINARGQRFALLDHPDAELGPRDIVSRAVHKADLIPVERGGGAFLDCTRAIGDKFPHEFPTVFASAMESGIDPRLSPLPVAPAAHYHMGGIHTDTEGRTSLKGLFAVGECASTGVHGANRLASNSLLEAAAFGERCGKIAASTWIEADLTHLLRPDMPSVLTEPNRARLRTAMSRFAGVVRDGEGLKALIGIIDGLEARAPNALALTSARLIAVSALRRRESRGSHYRSDCPQTEAVAHRTYIRWTDVQSCTEEALTCS